MPTYGTFSGNPKTEWLEDTRFPDRNMQLLENFSYTDPNDRVWSAPKGSKIDGASIPRPLWVMVGSPYTDDYRRASIVHDVACEDPTVNRKEADVMFYYACLAGGCGPYQAQVLYAGVRIGAWSNTFLPRDTFRPNNMLFQPEGSSHTDGVYLQKKLETIAADIRSQDNELSITQLESLIQKHIKTNG
jgi:hypothetical protein